MHKLSSFYQKVLDDILWCVASPSLIVHPDNFFCSQQEASQFAINIEQHILNDTKRFIESVDSAFLKLPSQRLGDRFEMLWQLAFEWHSEYDLLVRNLQIEGEGRTLGELDMIVLHTLTKEQFHIELSCKFYLYTLDKHHNNWVWIGPGKADYFHLKLRKTWEKQIPLVKRTETTQKLRQLNLQPRQSKVIFRGRLFYPYAHSEVVRGDTFKEYDHINLEAEHGFWMHQDEANTLFETNLPYKRISKQDWLSDTVMAENSHGALEIKRSEQLLVSGTEDKATHWFVVPNSW